VLSSEMECLNDFFIEREIRTFLFTHIQNVFRVSVAADHSHSLFRFLRAAYSTTCSEKEPSWSEWVTGKVIPVAVLHHRIQITTAFCVSAKKGVFMKETFSTLLLYNFSIFITI